MNKLLHIDADCFYAAVEVRDNPKLRGKPVAVGGDPGRRGVIATCSYEARKFGVHSAMASAHAMRLCPELHIVKPDFQRYRAVSRAINEIFTDYTDRIEPLSLDEAYLDVTDCTEYRGSATWVAQAIQARILRELGLTVSAGVAPVKFLAKIASDWNKPSGLFVIPPHQVEGFTSGLSAGKLPGVGPATLCRLHRFGLYECGDIRGFGMAPMVKEFGGLGRQLYERAWGRDTSKVETSRVRKSVSVERTYSEDRTLSELAEVIPELMGDLKSRYVSLKGQYAPQKYFVKLKFSDFSQTSLETSLPSVMNWPKADDFHRLLHLAWFRMRKPVRLAGLGLRVKSRTGCGPDGQEQLCLFKS